MKKPVILLLHLGYWFLYGVLLAICTLFMTLPDPKGTPIFFFNIVVTLLGFAILPGLAGFYSFYLFLFPRFLKTRKIAAMFAVGLLLSFLCGALGETVMSLVFGSVHDRNSHIFPHPNLGEVLFVVLVTGIIGMLNGGMGLTLRAFIEWYDDIRLKEDLNKKNYEMELALIKSQIHPHFLFNTINNIDVLILKDAEKASEYLNKLSDMMRFMLYETKTEKIPLAKELAYIEKYVELQKIRTVNPDYIQYHVEGKPADNWIEPMLFIPFVENAFKHAENKKVKNAVKIELIVSSSTLRFVCENAYTPQGTAKPEYGGLGNELIGRRLALLYPQRHTLTVEDTGSVYKVNLLLLLQHED